MGGCVHDGAETEDVVMVAHCWCLRAVYFLLKRLQIPRIDLWEVKLYTSHFSLTEL